MPPERWTRRRFLAGLAAGAAAPGLAARGSPRLRARVALRIAVLDGGGGAGPGIEQGAIEAARAAELLGRGFEVLHGADGSAGVAAARALLERTPRPTAILGGHTAADAIALADLAAEAGIPYANLAVDPPSLAEAAGRPTTFHLAPSVEDRVEALVPVLLPLEVDAWRVAAPPDADGERLRARVEDAARRRGLRLGAPLAVPAEDAGRAAGPADGILLAHTGQSRDALLARLGALAAADAVGERAFPPASAPRFRASAWDPRGQAYGAGELNERFRRRTGSPMDGLAWSGWFAVKALWEAWLRSPEPSPAALARSLATARGFDGHKGVPLAFDAERRLRQPLVVLEGAQGDPSEERP